MLLRCKYEHTRILSRNQGRLTPESWHPANVDGTVRAVRTVGIDMVAPGSSTPVCASGSTPGPVLASTHGATLCQGCSQIWVLQSAAKQEGRKRTLFSTRLAWPAVNSQH